MKSIHFLFSSMVCVATAQAAPTVTNEIVTDITPGSFCVVWTTDEAATGSLEIYADAAGTTPVTDAVITAHPTVSGSGSVRESAEDRGIMKVKVSNLTPETLYYYRSVSVSKTDYTETQGSLSSAQTVRVALRALTSPALTPLASPLVRFDFYLPDGITPAAGGLLIAEIPGAASPISAFVGGNSRPAPTVILDLNNLYDATTRETLPVSGNEPLTLTLEMGSSGRETLQFYLPSHHSTATVRDPQLTDYPLVAPVAMARNTSAGLAQVFVEFPAIEGHIVQIEYGASTVDLPWTAVTPAMIAQGDRLLWYDNGTPRTTSHPAVAGRRFLPSGRLGRCALKPAEQLSPWDHPAPARCAVVLLSARRTLQA